MGAWSFVVDIDRAKKVLDKKTKIKAFDIEELYQAIEDKILSLNIKNLAISDKIYVNGKEIRDDRLLLPKINGHPINRLDEENFELASKNENTNIRRYKIIEVVDWDGDLILSNFIRFQKTDTNLFVESNYFLYPR